MQDYAKTTQNKFHEILWKIQGRTHDTFVQIQIRGLVFLRDADSSTFY